jgi:hypothetical protein
MSAQRDGLISRFSMNPIMEWALNNPNHFSLGLALVGMLSLVLLRVSRNL